MESTQNQRHCTLVACGEADVWVELRATIVHTMVKHTLFLDCLHYLSKWCFITMAPTALPFGYCVWFSSLFGKPLSQWSPLRLGFLVTIRTVLLYFIRTSLRLAKEFKKDLSNGEPETIMTTALNHFQGEIRYRCTSPSPTPPRTWKRRWHSNAANC